MNRRVFLVAGAACAAQALWPTTGSAKSLCAFEQRLEGFVRDDARCDYVHDSQFKSASLLVVPTTGDPELWHFPETGTEVGAGPFLTVKVLATGLGARDLRDRLAPAQGAALPRLLEFQARAEVLAVAAARRNEPLSGWSHEFGLLADAAGLSQPLTAVWLIDRGTGTGWIHVGVNQAARYFLDTSADPSALGGLLKDLPTDAECVCAGPRGVVIRGAGRLVWHLADAWRALEPQLAKTGGAPGRPEFPLSVIENPPLPAALLGASNDPDLFLQRLAGSGSPDMPRQDPVVWLLRG
jgi:hypothetical protein